MVPCDIVPRFQRQYLQLGLVSYRLKDSTNKAFLREQRAQATGHLKYNRGLEIPSSQGSVCDVLPLFVTSNPHEHINNFCPESRVSGFLENEWTVLGVKKNISRRSMYVL